MSKSQIKITAEHREALAPFKAFSFLDIILASGRYGMATPHEMPEAEARALIDLLAAAPALAAALRSVLPFAQSRLEDIEAEIHASGEAAADANGDGESEAVTRHRKGCEAFEAARALLASIDGAR